MSVPEGRVPAYSCHAAYHTLGRTAELKRGGRSSCTHPARRAKCSRSQYVYSALRRLRRRLIRRSPSFSAVTAGRSLGLRPSESNTTKDSLRFVQLLGFPVDPS